MALQQSTSCVRCTDCGWPLAEPAYVVSRHPTTQGVIVYTRCACGRLRVWLDRDSEVAPRLLIANDEGNGA